MSERLSDRQVEEIIGNLLRIGVLISAVLVLAGGIFFLAVNGGAHPSYHAFRGEPADLRSVPSIFKDAAALNSRGVIQLGILLLILTPIARVAFSVVAFLLERDYLYVAVTLIVLGLLLYSLTA